MPRNIVLCSDGTNNTFDTQTNVGRFVEYLQADESQIVIYDSGVGTRGERSKKFEEYRRRSRAGEKVLKHLESPQRLWPLSVWDRLQGLVNGLGLDKNVRQLYVELAAHYTGTENVFLFGFSRGAFTVRALAGLLYRCQLPKDGADAHRAFEQAWSLFQEMKDPKNRTEVFRKQQRFCSIHFLGLWDTVKSYGIKNPVMLPHLRHNPIVTHVRHALALDEQRAFFQATTWGLLDLDEHGAMKRLTATMTEDDLNLLERQRDNIEEVWFTGCHRDVGGGGDRLDTGAIALRWMLGEAVNVENGVRLNSDGKAFLEDVDPKAEMNESQTLLCRFLERCERFEINNEGEWPTKVETSGHTGRRDLSKFAREGKVCLHETVTDRRSSSLYCVSKTKRSL